MKIIGTSPDSIDLAEDRERFKELLDQVGLRQPENGTARSIEEALGIAQRIGYPVLARPSYVLGGRAMEIVYDQGQLERYLKQAFVSSAVSLQGVWLNDPLPRLAATLPKKYFFGWWRESAPWMGQGLGE